MTSPYFVDMTFMEQFSPNTDLLLFHHNWLTNEYIYLAHRCPSGIETGNFYLNFDYTTTNTRFYVDTIEKAFEEIYNYLDSRNYK